jgi:plastocyanin
MKARNSTFVVVALCMLMASFGIVRSAQAQQVWKAIVGAESKDMARQAMAFLPNELWIHEGDSIMWTSGTGEIHTVSFFIANQPYTNFNVGCPNYSASGSSFNGTKCVSAPPLIKGQTFTIKFPKAGNFSLICLVHPHMTGVIHVLGQTARLPHDQYFYNELAESQTHSLLSDADQDKDHHSHEHMKDMVAARVMHANGVAAGVGEMNQTAGGFQSLSVVRFLKENIDVHVGDTVEWSVLDPSLPHTITFGVEPANPGPPVNVTFDKDGARHAMLHAPGDTTHSGIIGAVPMNQVGVPQSPPSIPVFRVTFTGPGTYQYKCALHDNLGMVGTVVVRP